MADKSIKLVIFGDEQVGKSSLTRRFTKDSFSEDYKRTIGVNIESVEVEFENCVYELLVWDIEGSLSSTAMNSTYLMGADHCLIAASLDNGESINRLEEYFSLYGALLSNEKYTPVLNKCDLLAGSLEDRLKQLRVNDQVLSRFNDDSYGLTSAKTGDGCTELIHKVIKGTEES